VCVGGGCNSYCSQQGNARQRCDAGDDIAPAQCRFPLTNRQTDIVVATGKDNATDQPNTNPGSSTAKLARQGVKPSSSYSRLRFMSLALYIPET
jgi:hypothetical protein